ncbi:hypothetical protein [Streptomyces sp. NPDC058280]|uniref:hypothetical protein n=1 Tax=Streptomyces sp. NPDC058280 TaxID=3346419 RepID=UPI0036E7B23D
MVGGVWLLAGARRGTESAYPVDGHVQVFAEAADGGCCVLEVVVQVEAVIEFGVLGLLGCGFEEVREAFQQSGSWMQDLVGQCGGELVRLGGVELVGEMEDRVAVDVAAIRTGRRAGVRVGGQGGSRVGFGMD